MSREIKFRAIHKSHKDKRKSKPKMIYDVQNTYDNNNGDSFRDFLNPSYYLMQFTGLKTQFNREIYEGDLFSNYLTAVGHIKGTDRLYEVRFDQEICSFKLYMQDDTYGFPLMEGLDTSLSLSYVGNIHENKDLLE